MNRPFRAMALALAAVARLSAHDPGLSTTQVIVHEATVEISVGFAPADVRALLPPSARAGGAWSSGEFESAKPLLLEMGRGLWQVAGETGPTALTGVRVALASGSNLTFDLSYARPAGPLLSFRALALGRLPPGHRDYLTVSDETGHILVEKLVDASDGAIQVALPSPAFASAASALPRPTFLGFVTLGILHIWTGYDHLLFLFGLLVVCRRLKSIIAVISCFTVAHSLTLALSTLNIVSIPSRIVEPAIAASIAFVGIENLLRRGAEPRGRWALTFAFGLVHGFGFASALKELGVGSDGRGIALPLFTFNLGVEIGQIAVALIVLPILWQLRKNPGFVRLGVPALSAIAAAAGLYWFLGRTIYS